MDGILMSGLKIDLAFPHHFQLEALPAAPAGAVRIPSSPEAVDALHLRITPDGGAPWVGSFARGYETGDLASGVWAWPDGQSLAVVSSGYGYAGKASEGGRNWARLQPMPITDVRVLEDEKLLLFVDFTHLYAYSATKNAWRSERISWDGITITKVATHHVFGVAWDAMQDKEVEFALDVRTGEHTGGATPWAKK